MRRLTAVSTDIKHYTQTMRALQANAGSKIERTPARTATAPLISGRVASSAASRTVWDNCRSELHSHALYKAQFSFRYLLS